MGCGKDYLEGLGQFYNAKVCYRTVFIPVSVIGRESFLFGLRKAGEEVERMWKDLSILEKKAGYIFRDKGLLKRAMTHSSYLNEHRQERLECNERLEFLGDAVLELTVSETLYQRYPKKPEGELTRFRASIVCEPTLALCAKELDLGEYLLLGNGEENGGGRGRASVTSDAMEALIGAIYIDGGFASAKEFIHRFILTDIEHKQLFYDSKTILQEIVQRKSKEGLTYRLTKEEGPDHNKHYEVDAVLGDRIIGSGSGRTKKAAEMEAAYHAILMERESGCI